MKITTRSSERMGFSAAHNFVLQDAVNVGL